MDHDEDWPIYFKFPKFDEWKAGPASAEDVALWLHENGVKQVDTADDLCDVFNDYGLLYGYTAAKPKQIFYAVSKSDHWDTKRGKKPAKKTYYLVKIPRNVLIREVA